jgi:hypothetical protein
LEFPWYEALDDIWKHNPAYAPRTFLSALGADHVSGMMALTSNHKGKEKETTYKDELMDTTNIFDSCQNSAPAVGNHISVGMERAYLHELSIDHLHYGVA